MLSRNIRATFARVSHPRLLHSSPELFASNSHSPDTYAKDVDETPPDDSQVFRVDPQSDKVQKADEEPSGPYSRAGAMTEEYQTVNKRDEPYETPSKSMKYGAMDKESTEKNPPDNARGQGPEGTERKGRQPDRK